MAFFLLQAQDYRIQYDSIVRLFVLPKNNTPHTLVVISLDPPIRKGQTYYPHILVQFPSDEERSIELDISDEALAAKNEKVSVPLSLALLFSRPVLLYSCCNEAWALPSSSGLHRHASRRYAQF
jgi:hypothetical protein